MLGNSCLTHNRGVRPAAADEKSVRLEYQVIRHESHWEITVRGEVPDVLSGPDPYDQIPDGSRVLQDSRGFDGVNQPGERWIAGAKKAAERGLKVAIVVHRPVMFGLYRQALLTSMVDEEYQISVFVHRDEAFWWLMSELPASEFRGRRRD